MSRRTVAEDPPSEQLELGSKIRHLRTEAGLTLEALARRADVSVSLISQVERGRAEPSLTSLRRMAAALGAPVAQLFVGGEQASVGESDRFGRRLVVRRDERKHLRVPESDIVYELLVPDLNRKLEVLWGEVGPGATTPPAPSHHGGEEVIVCLVGSLTCIYDGEEFVLGPGDAISWDPSVPHRIENRTTRPVQMIVVLTPPSF